MKNRKLQTQTLKTKVLLVIAAVCIPVLILFFGMSFFSIRKIQNQIYENNQNLLRSNVNQLDAELNKISEYLLNESTNDQQMNLFSSSDPVKSYDGAILYTRKFYEDINFTNSEEDMEILEQIRALSKKETIWSLKIKSSSRYREIFDSITRSTFLKFYILKQLSSSKKAIDTLVKQNEELNNKFDQLIEILKSK